MNQVDCLWSCLITRIPDRFHFLLLSWLLKQTNNKELHALGLDNYKHIFMNKVCINYLFFLNPIKPLHTYLLCWPGDITSSTSILQRRSDTNYSHLESRKIKRQGKELMKLIKFLETLHNSLSNL